MPLWLPFLIVGVLIVLASPLVVWALLGDVAPGHPAASASATEPEPPTPPIPAVPPGWVQVTASDGAFGIAMPEQPTISTQHQVLEDYGDAEITLYLVPAHGDGQLSMNRAHVTASIPETDVDELSQGMLDEFAAGMKDTAPGATVTMGLATPTTVGTRPGFRTQMTLTAPTVTQTVEVAVTVTEHDVYQFAAFGDQRARFDAMLSTFSILR